MDTPPPRRPPSGPPVSTDLFAALADRQDAGIERLTHALAKVLSESAQSNAAGRAADLEAIRADVTELRSELRNAIRDQANATTRVVDAGVASIRSSLVDIPAPPPPGPVRAMLSEQDLAPLRSDLAGVGQGVRDDLRAVVEALRTDLAALRTSVGSADGAGRARTEEQLERLRTELVASLGALHHALQEPLEAAAAAQEHTVSSLHSDLGATVRLLQRALAESTSATAEAVAAVQRQVDELAATARGIAASQDELRGLVRQLWGDDSAE